MLPAPEGGDFMELILLYLKFTPEKVITRFRET
jgi:hypothetical protein